MKRFLALCTSILLGVGFAALGVVAPAAADEAPAPDTVVVTEVVTETTPGRDDGTGRHHGTG